MAVRRAHHGNLDALIAQSRDTSGPFAFDRGPPFELEAELAKEINRRREVIDDDSHIVHPFKRHVCNLQGGIYSDNGPWNHLRRFSSRSVSISADSAAVSGAIPRLRPWVPRCASSTPVNGHQSPLRGRGSRGSGPTATRSAVSPPS